MTARPILALLVCGALALPACEDPPQVKPDKSADAGASGQPVENTHIAEALASAAKGTKAGGEGPPANGVFAPGAADKAHPKNKPIEVSLIDKGADPKVKLTPLLELNKAAPLDVTVVRVEQSQSGRSVVAVTFSLLAVTPADAPPEPPPAPDTEVKDAPVKDKKAEDASEAVAKPITVARPIMFSVVGVRPASQKDIPLSEDELKKLEKLKGATITAKVAPDGSLSTETFELPKDADPSAGHTVRVLAETIGLFFSPLPSEPVGKGAYWIASDRASLAGMDVIRYRVTKIEELDGDQAVLSLDLRVYVAGNGEVPTGSPEGAVALMFQAQGKAEFGRKGGALLPVSTQALELQIMMQVAQSADAQVAQVYQHKTVGILQPPNKPGEGDDAPKTPKDVPQPAPKK